MESFALNFSIKIGMMLQSAIKQTKNNKKCSLLNADKKNQHKKTSSKSDDFIGYVNLTIRELSCSKSAPELAIVDPKRPTKASGVIRVLIYFFCLLV